MGDSLKWASEEAEAKPSKRKKKVRPKVRRVPQCGRFWVWVEYKGSSGDLDAWVHHVARAYSNGGGTMLHEDLRDLSFDVATRPGAIAMARRIANVMKLARSDGSWRVYVNDTRNENENGSALKLWALGEIAKTKTRRMALRRKARKR